MTVERFQSKAYFLIFAVLLGACGEPAVGAPCLPEKVPSNGFNQNESYIESSSVQCETRVCMVYQLEGNPVEATCQKPEECTGTTPEELTVCRQRRCADEKDVRDHVYCTCRCKAEAGFEECECPDSFKCKELLEGGGPGVKGSYCVRSSTTS